MTNRIEILTSLIAALALCVTVAPVRLSVGDDAANSDASAETVPAEETADDQPSDAEPTPTAEKGDKAATTEGTETDGETTKGDDAAEETEPPPSIDDLPWELRPYRVLISVAFADRRTMGDAFAEATVDTLHSIIRGEIGPYWKPTIQVNDWMFPQTPAAIEQLTAESLTQRFGHTDYDKVLTVVLESQGPAYRLTGCEWDRTTEQRGPTVQRLIVDRRRVAAVLFETLRTLFRPIAEIELADGTAAELRVRGGELLSPESPLFPFQTGDLLTGHFRYLDRDRKVRKIQPVPWTYLRIEQVSRSRMTAYIETAFSSPLSGSRRRVELVAMRVEPAYAQTLLSLSPRTNPNKPLVGVRVRIYESLPTEENPNPERVDLMTNRQGVVAVPSSPDSPLRRLIIHSGGAVLSNVPFVPGIDRELSMLLPDDSPRLQVEGNLAMVQGDLIDVVSRRAVMMGRALSLAKKEKFAEADKLLAAVDAQPSIASFESRILAIRVPAVDQAKANRNRSQQKRIRIMCSDVEKLVRKYLDREKLDNVKDEVSELKKIAG